MGITKDTWIWDDPPMYDFREAMPQREPPRMCELPDCRHRLCVCGHAECDHADENVQPNCADCNCQHFHELVAHGDTSPCIDREEQVACEWAFDGGDDSVGVSWCWTCKTCGAVDINRDPPSDPDEDAYERNL